MLYRLLCILYAEARELLPPRTSAAYRADYSFDLTPAEITIVEESTKYRYGQV